MIIDFSQQIRLSIFVDFWYNQLNLSVVIECYQLSILLIAQVGSIAELSNSSQNKCV